MGSLHKKLRNSVSTNNLSNFNPFDKFLDKAVQPFEVLIADEVVKISDARPSVIKSTKGDKLSDKSNIPDFEIWRPFEKELEHNKSKSISASDNEPRVGAEYQAEIPELSINLSNSEEIDDSSVLFWAPCPENVMSDSALSEYVDITKEKYKYTEEQALGILSWFDYDVPAANEELVNFEPESVKWTIKEKLIFKNSIKKCRKNFRKIQKQLPDKTIANLVSYYYQWKKPKSKKLKKNQTKNHKSQDNNNDMEGGNEI